MTDLRNDERGALLHVPAVAFVSTVEVSRAMKRPAHWVRNRLKWLERGGYVRQVSRGDASTPSLWVRTADGDRLLKETGAGNG